MHTTHTRTHIHSHTHIHSPKTLVVVAELASARDNLRTRTEKVRICCAEGKTKRRKLDTEERQIDPPTKTKNALCVVCYACRRVVLTVILYHPPPSTIKTYDIKQI